MFKRILSAVVSLLILAGHVMAEDITTSQPIAGASVNYAHALWDGIPIQIILPVGHERIVRFDGSVDFKNSDARLTRDKLAVLNNAGFLYLTAKKPFKPIRVECVIDGKVVLVDLSATKDAPQTPIQVVLSSEQATGRQGMAKQSPDQGITFVTLMRYAIQQLYAPKRLLVANSAIARAPMFVTKSIDLFNNAQVISLPLASWQGGQLFVTAVLVKNVGHTPISLSADHLNGSFLAASFYPLTNLNASGRHNDRTTVFLLSDRPVNQALTQMKEYRT